LWHGQRKPRHILMPHILYAEDHRVVAHVVKETLEHEGWRVVLCYDGAIAVSRLASQAKYDLLLFDNHLPNVNGLELVRYARQFPHRKGIPIIMLSADYCEREARLAGANEFLMKPRDIGRIVETVARLLDTS
jgi:CheY-like chemotaxis protein